MWIDRQIEPLLLGRAATRPVVVLTGARQTGKTSLVRRLFPDHAYVTLDLPSEAEQAEHDPASFLARHPPPLIVDEVQYAPGLFRHLKAAVDRERGRTGAFLLTGSQPLSGPRASATPAPTGAPWPADQAPVGGSGPTPVPCVPAHSSPE